MVKNKYLPRLKISLHN